MHVVDVEIDDQQQLMLTVESGQVEAACPACGVLAVATAVEFVCFTMRRASPGSPY